MRSFLTVARASATSLVRPGKRCLPFSHACELFLHGMRELA